jgi:sugar lactone lactonase YvrE
MSHIPVPVVRAENHGSNLPGFATPAKRVAPGDIRIWTLALAALLLATAGAQAQAVFGTIAVGGSTPPAEQSVSVTALVGGTVNSVKILTAGASNQDFTAGSGASCVPATPLAAGAACTQSVTFTPAAPGLRIGAVVLLDSSGNVLGTAYLSGTGLGGLGILVPGNILPVAGKDGVYEGPVVNGIPAIQGELNHPSSVTLDGAGNLYIADRYHNMIRMVCASASSATIYGTAAACTGAGIITTIAGNGNPVYTGDTESSLLATLNTPWGVALDGAGNLYIADTQNNAIRKITAATGIISTVAGNISGNVCGEKTDPAGDGCPAISSTLNYPQGVTIDAGGNLYIADTNNHRIRRVDAVSGIITTIAGNGFVNTDGSGGYFGDNGKASLAELNYPFAVAFDSQGNMYIPDSLNNRVRLVTAVSGVVSGNSIITTFAGTGLQGYAGDGDAAATAKMFAPSGVIADPAGNVYIADTQNNAIRKVSSATSSTPGIISTVAVNGVGQYFYNGNFAPISIDGPIGLYLDSGGNLYFADVLKMQIQEIQSNFAALDYLLTPIRQGSKSATQDQTVENDGNAALDLTTINPVQNSALDAAATTCTTGAPYLAVAADCVVGAVFAPSASILPTDPEYGTIDVGKAGDTVNSPLDIELVGIATLVNSTTTTVTSNINPSGFGQSVTFTATVTTGGGTGNLTGTVSFFDGANTLAANVPRNAPPGTTVTATFATAALAVGVHTITATYNAQDAADPTHFSSTSSPYTQTVNESTATNLASSANPSNLGASVTFTATVTIAGGGGVAPDGTVTFMDGATILGSPRAQRGRRGYLCNRGALRGPSFDHRDLQRGRGQAGPCPALPIR